MLEKFDAVSVLTGIVVAILPATLFSWSKGYFDAKGKNFATIQDIDRLQRQLEENTEITRSIEQRYSREDHVWRAELLYREKQLAELYGPAYGYLKSQKEIVELWTERKVDAANFQVKKLLSSQNKLLRDLIIEKSHLIDGPAMPSSFVRFFTSTLVFDLYAAPTEDGEVPQHLKDDLRAAYPWEFDELIFETTERLKSRVYSLKEKSFAMGSAPEPGI